MTKDEQVYLARLESIADKSLCTNVLTQEAWEMLHSGYYKNVSGILRACFVNSCKLLAELNHEKLASQYYWDLSYIYRVDESQEEGMEVFPSDSESRSAEEVSWNTHVECSSECNVISVPAESSIEDLVGCLIQRKPFVVRGGCAHWPAVSNWKNPSFWLKAFGPNYAPAEIGCFTDRSFLQGIVSIADFVKFIGAPKSLDTPQVYIAQYDVFKRFPLISSDISSSVDLLHMMGVLESRNLFLGPRGTITQAHQDPYCNLLCQVFGTKYIRLFDPSIDMSALQTDNRSKNKIPTDWNTYECYLSDGDCMYIPEGWWHYLESLSVSCSVAHFCFTN